MIATSHITPRSVSEPLAHLGPSGPSSSSGMGMASAMHHRAMGDHGQGAPRNSSMDSAISSVSGSLGGRKSSSSSHSAPAPEAADVANLIQAAGSAETLIQQLLKEKQSQAAQNAQLWRLVDKQRAMVLGLNKDLERALKDKERYRQKLKEQLALPAHAADEGAAGVEINKDLARGDAHKATPAHLDVATANNGRAIMHREVSPVSPATPISPMNVAIAPYPVTPTQNEFNSTTMSQIGPAEHKMPSPRSHAFQNYDSDRSPGQHTSANPSEPRGYNVAVPPSRSAPNGPPPSSPPPKAPPPGPTPSLSIIEASPNPNEGSRTFSAPRKAPPAPLNLGSMSTSAHLRQASEDTDSDYDDILEVDEIPSFERGRRKTREDDDRMRELAAKDGDGGDQPVKGDLLTLEEAQKVPIPASPRQTIPIPPPETAMRDYGSTDAQPGSLVGMLSAAQHDTGGARSPGLPVSPRPVAKAPPPLASPPVSPRMAGFVASVPLSPRAPRQPIPMPPGTPMSMASPKTIGQPQLSLRSPKPLQVLKKSDYLNSPISPIDARSPHSPTAFAGFNIVSSAVYRGLVSDEYPGLLLPPNALPSINVKVASSRLKPSRASILFPKSHDEDPVFTLAISSRSDARELWRVEKDSASLGELDATLKKSGQFSVEVPEKSLFNGHAPAKLDARRKALNKYIEDVLDTQMDNASALLICQYLSTNVVAPQGEDGSPIVDVPGGDAFKFTPSGRPIKNGYLTKRGKNFGGWKARYFMLDGPILRYYESPGGPHLGTIKLPSAQIGKQSQHNESSAHRNEGDDQDNQYRHAFLILEPKRKDSTALVRHVLCAESDKERDQWVDALLKWVDFKEQDEATENVPPNKVFGPSSRSNMSELNTSLLGVSYESTKQGSLPGTGMPSTPSPPVDGNEKDPLSALGGSPSLKTISAPKNAQLIQDVGAWGNKNQLPPVGEKRDRKRSFFSFGGKPSRPTAEDSGAEQPMNLTQMAVDQHGIIRPQFGAPLIEAVRYNHPADVQVELPAVVYRCVEYLEAKGAVHEEGIFRLSGSNIVIRSLRERFNTEGDVNLLTDDQFYDVHAVASLLKLYLRELPTTILTPGLHLDFLAITEISNAAEKVAALKALIRGLPSPNLSLLRYLSAFLIDIINHADTNKMTLRNVGIVFSPTLNIPAPVFALFLQQYDGVFGSEPDAQSASGGDAASSSFGDEPRSPMRQRFQEGAGTARSNHPPSFPQPQHYQPGVSGGMHEGQTMTDDPRGLFNANGGSSYSMYSAGTGSNHSYDQIAPDTIVGAPVNGGAGGGGGASSSSWQAQGQQQGPMHSAAAAPPAITPKSKRRESSMFSMGFGGGGGGGGNGTAGGGPGKKSSKAQLRNDCE